LKDDRSFWARRKAGVAAEAEAAQAVLEAEAVAEQHAAYEDKSDAEILAELELPDPDTLRMGDDFTAFMSKAVPDRIRRRALRRLWRSNPVLANVDMLVDYGEDFTDSAMAVENIQTAYQVGKGMLKHIEEMARKAEEQANPEPIETLEEPVEEELIVATCADPLPAEAPDAIVYEEPLEAVTPAPRRMKFKVEETL